MGARCEREHWGEAPPRDAGRRTSLAASVLGLAVAAVVLTAGQATAQLCDADANGTVTDTDGVLVLRAAAGLAGACALERCDVNQDGVVSDVDGVNVLRAAAQLPSACDVEVEEMLSDIVNRAQGATLVDGEAQDVTEGTYQSGGAPTPEPDAEAAITDVEPQGEASAIPEFTRSLTVTYTAGGAGVRPAAANATLIVTARRPNGTPVHGFFEVPVDTTASEGSVIGITFPAALAAGGFDVRFALRVDGVLSQFFDVSLARADPPGGKFLQLVDRKRDDVGGVVGLASPAGVALSPDGAQVYVAARDDNAIAVFARDPASGKLDFVEAQVDGAAGVSGLQLPTAVAVSPDGTLVYAVSGVDSQVVCFARDPNTGGLSFIEAVGGATGSARAVAVSADGASVYVASVLPTGGEIAVFSQSSLSGFRLVQRLEDGLEGVDGLDGANSVAVSRDGAHVYATGLRDDAVAVFTRSPTAGILRFVEVVRDGVACNNCLRRPSSVAVSPEGSDVLVTSRKSRALALFSRDPVKGSLTFRQALVAGPGIEGLGLPTGVAVSDSGGRVYVVSDLPFARGALVAFSRNPNSGDLTFLEALLNGVGGILGLQNPTALAVSPGAPGLHVYVTSPPGSLAAFATGE